MPSDTLSAKQTRRGLQALIVDGIFAQMMGVLIGGAFLAAFTLKLGGTSRTIGFLAAISPLAQILQIPAIFLIDRIRLRKLLVILTVAVGRALWLFVAVIPWALPRHLQLPFFLGTQVLYYALSAVAACAWNSWIRDFVPESLMATYFARRAAWFTAFGAAISLLAGLVVERLEPSVPSIYSLIFILGTISGLLGAAAFLWVPEPRMATVRGENPLTLLAEPFRDVNYRALLIFLAWWSFAVNMAAPFFAVYMLQEIRLGMGWVVGLSVISQAFNVVFFRFWGRLAARFANKPCLAVSGTLFVFSIGLWPFTTMPQRHLLTLPLLVIIHALAGMSTAGVALCGGNIALKAAPYGRATAYLGVNALVGGASAVVAPLISGVLADSLAAQHLRIALSWNTSTKSFSFPAVDMKGMDFVFVASFIFGLYALHRLLAVKEQGEVEEAIVREQVLLEMRKLVRHISNVAGIRHLTHFPYMILRYVMRSGESASASERSAGPSSAPVGPAPRS